MKNMRASFNITSKQKKQIENEARKEERSESFIVRRIIEKYFGDKNEN